MGNQRANGCSQKDREDCAKNLQSNETILNVVYLSLVGNRLNWPVKNNSRRTVCGLVAMPKASLVGIRLKYVFIS